MDLDAAIASPSEVKKAIIAHIESIDAAVATLNGIRDTEMAKLELIERLEELE